MSKNTRVIPFTEIVERVQDLTRSASDDKKRIRGVVNNRYMRSMPREFDWRYLKSSSSLLTTAEYKSGVVSVNTQNTACVFSGAVITSAMTGRKIKFTNNNNIYDFTYTTTAGGTISPPLSLATNISMGAYSIYQDEYALMSDFDRFPINGGILYYSGGRPTPLPEKDDDDYYEEATASPTATPDSCRILPEDSAGQPVVQIIPPPSVQLVMPYEYLKTLPPMREFTGGTIAVTGTAVTGDGTVFSQANTGDYLRQDFMGQGVDSEWYRINTITGDTGLTLATSVASNNAAGSDYVVCSVPQYPTSLQEALVYGGVRDILPDQNDPTFIDYNNKYAQVLSDNKTLILNRRSKQDVELIAQDWDYRR